MKKIFILIFSMLATTIVLIAQPDADIPTKDQVIADDLIVTGSIAVGFDAVIDETFGYSTILLKENNLRIRFWDTSTTGTFPNNDWELQANDTGDGGLNHFSIYDVTGSKRPFTVEAGAPTNSLYVDDGGRLGIGTASPVVNIHNVTGNTPTLRLEQNGSSGFTPQTWDVAGNEANFFIRDATNGSNLPFRIQPGASSNTLTLSSGSNVGIGTLTPEHKLEVVGDAQVNSYFYFGDESTEGNWRVSVIDSKLTFEKLESGVWISKVEMD